MSLQEDYDVVILGTGPAGLQAAIHAARKRVSVLVLGKQSKSSLYQAHVENFCCIFKLSGEEMIKTGREQAAGFGAHFLEEDILQITSQANHYNVKTESGRQIGAKSLIIATGTSRQRLGASGEKALLGKGVSYCVDCDGHFYRDAVVVVVGDESAAVDGALTLAEIAAQVHLVCKDLQISPGLQQKLKASPVVVHHQAVVKEIVGDDAVTGIRLDDGSHIAASGVFIELGAKGVVELATSLGIRLDDEMRYIRTDKQQATNLAGLYAAGDICGPPWQMAKAVGEGCVAGIEAAGYAKKLSD
jgi:thioredoxin reductase (NADPH)